VQRSLSRPTNVAELFALYETRSHLRYGESVTQLDHALQCAALARDDGANDALIAAALFHDVGHLVVDEHGDPRFDRSSVDDRHETLGARILSPLLGLAVAQPVALHVTAKRWRCTRDPDYYDRLSSTSQATLRAQGGLLSEAECLRFEEHPGFREALWLRAWDDSAKATEREVGSLRDWEPLVRALAAAR
jgi:predicted HD phosphohydrolase